MALRDRIELWWWVNERSARRSLLFVVVASAAVALAVLVRRDATLVLEYARVLAWPFVLLAALLLFREPVVRVLRNLYLEELELRGSKARFAQRQTSGVIEQGDLSTELENLRLGVNVAGALLQAYEVQIEFLRALGQARDGLTRAAAESWFDDRIANLGLDPDAWNGSGLLNWLETRGLVGYTSTGNIIRSELGDQVIALSNSFWYSPKLV